jgi:hypothetical protein
LAAERSIDGPPTSIFSNASSSEQIDGDDLVLLQSRDVFREVSTCQERTVNRGMQCLHPAIEELGEVGDLLHLKHRDVAGPERRRGPAGGDDLPSQPH